MSFRKFLSIKSYRFQLILICFESHWTIHALEECPVGFGGTDINFGGNCKRAMRFDNCAGLTVVRGKNLTEFSVFVGSKFVN